VWNLGCEAYDMGLAGGGQPGKDLNRAAALTGRWLGLIPAAASDDAHLSFLPPLASFKWLGWAGGFRGRCWASLPREPCMAGGIHASGLLAVARMDQVRGFVLMRSRHLRPHGRTGGGAGRLVERAPLKV